MASAIESFFVALGFQIDTTKLDEFQKKTEELRASVLKVGTIATAAVAGLGAMIIKVAQGMDDVGDFADIVGMTAVEVDALGKIAKQNDSSMEAMQATMRGLASVTGQAALGIGRGAMIFEKLGFSAKNAEGKTKSASDMLAEVADRMKEMNATDALAMASKLQIDPSLIPLLRRGGDEFRRLRAEAEAANPFTEEQYKQADELVKLWNKATASMGLFTKRLAASLFPVMKKVLETFNGWFKAGKSAFGDAITTGVKGFVALLGTVWDWLMRLADAVLAASKWLSQFSVIAWAASAALAAFIAYKAGAFFISLGAAVLTAAKALMTFNAAAALPTILIGGLVIAVGILVDELWNFYEGNNSIIGQLQKDYPGAIYGAWALLGLLAGGFVLLKRAAIVSMYETMAIMVLYAYNYVKLAAAAVAQLAVMAAGWVSTAAAAIASAARIALAWLVSIGPVGLVIAGVIAVGAALYALWANWEEISTWIGEKWDGLKAKAERFIGLVRQGIEWAKKLFGITGSDQNINVTQTTRAALAQAPALMDDTAALAAGAAPAMATMSSGNLLGRAETINNGAPTTSINAPVTGNTFHITTADPQAAADEVMDRIARSQRAVIRNGQTGHF